MGARVTGLDLSQPISDAAENALKAAFLDYHLLCFESRPLSVEKFLVFARVFGTPQLQLLSNLQITHINYTNFVFTSIAWFRIAKGYRQWK